MSALVSHNESNTEINNQGASVAAISTNARIDYILRFSKQAILVVDELSANYSHIGNLFLGDLPENHNAAYLAVSAKFNDIQIRCRLIEQLFAGVLFDPEQPLAVSILRLTKNSPQPISIVIDHAHLLSFKILHELCYLAEVAKKTQQEMNIVMLATPAAARKISVEKSLFKQKLAIVSAETGQLLKLDDKIFKEKKSFNIVRYIKVFIIFIVLLTLISTAYWGLKNREMFSFSALPPAKLNQTKTLNELKPTIKPIAKSKLVNKQQQSNIVLVATKNTLISKIKEKIQLKDKTTKKASATDIFNALITVPAIILPAASPVDILTALQISENTTAVTENITTTAVQVNKIPTLNKVFSASYYLEAISGYVVQLGGFSDKNGFEQEKVNYSKIDYGVYDRLLNNRKFTVITSKIYNNKLAALKAIELLPATLQQQQPWVKSVTAIQKEIISYQKLLNE